MANTNRRILDRSGKMFIPMNVEGGSWDENFITTGKLVWIVLSVVTGVLLVFWLKGNFAPVSSYFIVLSVYMIILQFVLRFIIFEEKFYYKMYKEMKRSEISTPSVFWNIASVKDTMDGAILNFSDARIALIIRLERDTITGKEESFREVHFDAVSDFYKELMNKKYSFVQMNLMEPAGNDPRLLELDKLTSASDNESINKLMEMQIGYIKNITHKTLYETEYVMIYTSDVARYDQIVNDAIECVSKIQDGAYIGYTILTSRDIIELVKETYGVKYFDYVEATLEMFRNNGIVIDKPFDIAGIEFSGREYEEVDPKEINKITTMASRVANGTLDIEKTSIRDTLFPRENKKNAKVGVDFNSLSEVPKENTSRAPKILRRKQQPKESSLLAEEFSLSVADFEEKPRPTFEDNFDDDETLDF